MTDYEAVVYDLDGTLVDLDVDWAAAASDVRAAYRRAGVEPPGDDLWDMLSAADRHDLRAAVEGVIAEHERAGARTAGRLPLADELAKRRIPSGVCSLNAEAACRIALDVHDLADAVDAVVGRDSVGAMKPDPEPLLEAVGALGAVPGRTLFVGDTERDATTAERAGTAFRHVDEFVEE